MLIFVCWVPSGNQRWQPLQTEVYAWEKSSINRGCSIDTFENRRLNSLLIPIIFPKLSMINIDWPVSASVYCFNELNRLVITRKSTPETIDFPIKCRAFRFQFSLKPIHWMSSSPHWNHHFPMVFLWFFPHVLQRKKSTISPAARRASVGVSEAYQACVDSGLVGTCCPTEGPEAGSSRTVRYGSYPLVMSK